MNANIIGLLKRELENSQASITGYFLSCALVTNKGVYVGSNKEFDDGSFAFEHAETSAIKECLRVENEPTIRKIFLCGRGKVKKLKHYVPCATCCDVLDSYCSSDTEVVLVDINNNDSTTIFNFNELRESYSFKEISRLQVNSLHLREKDNQFLQRLIREIKGKVEGVFLTGSASGRGGFTSFLRKKFNLDYGDLDLFIILKKENLQEIINLVNSSAIEIYPDLHKVIRKVPKYQNKKCVVLEKSYFGNNDTDEPVLDFTYSTQLEGSFIRNEYFERNWYVELIG